MYDGLLGHCSEGDYMAHDVLSNGLYSGNEEVELCCAEIEVVFDGVGKGVLNHLDPPLEMVCHSAQQAYHFS